MALASPVSIVLQNLWLTWVYWVAFVVVVFLTGAWLGVLIAFVVASGASFAYRRFVNKTLPAAPRKSAVLITGCSTGIGLDAAARLTKCGFLTFATVRKDSDIAALKAACGNSNMLHPLILDVTSEQQIKAAVETVKQKMQQDGGRQLLGVVNNAGYADQCPIELEPLQAFRAQYETNVFGAVAVTQAFIPLLRNYTDANKGHSARLIFVSSIGGRFSAAGSGPYCSSKYAVEAIGDSLRMELKHWNIDVSLIEPGAIGTSFFNTAESNTTKRSDEARAALAAGKFPAGQQVLDHYVAAEAKRVAETSKIPFESMSHTSDAIESALLDSQPLARYTAAWSSLAVFPFTKLPTEVVDFVLGRLYR